MLLCRTIGQCLKQCTLWGNKCWCKGEDTRWLILLIVPSSEIFLKWGFKFPLCNYEWVTALFFKLLPSPSSYCPLLQVTALSFKLLPSPSSYCPLLQVTALTFKLLPSPSSYCPLLQVTALSFKLLPSPSSRYLKDRFPYTKTIICELFGFAFKRYFSPWRCHFKYKA